MGAITLDKRMFGFGLTTASILYRLPDHPGLLQTFTWQQYDLAPRFPKLLAFLEFWKRELDGPVHSVTVAHKGLVGPPEVRLAQTEFRLQ